MRLKPHSCFHPTAKSRRLSTARFMVEDTKLVKNICKDCGYCFVEEEWLGYQDYSDRYLDDDE